MEINKDEIITDPSTLMAQVFYLMNMWAELDMARMRGEFTDEEQVQTFSGLVKPLAIAYKDIILDVDKTFIMEVMTAEQDIRMQVAADVLLDPTV